MTLPTEAYLQAQRRLARRDPVLRRLIRVVGPCTLQPEPDGFRILVNAILSQMISTKAAVAIRLRLEQALGRGGVTPAAVARAPVETLRGAGLSGAKARALHDLAARVQGGALPLRDLPGMSDDEAAALLVQVRGIGHWTAQMYLIFSLGRLDVLPVDDFGLRAGVREQYGLPDLPRAAELRARAEPWRPYRSVATWYFWRSRGFVPQSEAP